LGVWGVQEGFAIFLLGSLGCTGRICYFSVREFGVYRKDLLFLC
jgi:hypothetical protein